MKFLKRALPIVLAVCLLASLGAVSAIDAMRLASNLTRRVDRLKAVAPRLRR